MSHNDLDNDGSLYAKHKKVYPREVHGLFASLRILGVLVLLGSYYIVPWLQWDGHQAVLFDLPARRFYIFSITFWPQDFFYLAVLLIIAALSLFFFTALAGRLWCGYACPQTVWTEVFLWIERKIEGSRNRQIKNDNAPMNTSKFWHKTLKHIIYIVLSAWTGLTFVGYFTPIDQIASNLVELTLGPWEWFWIVFYSLATYGNAAFLREQVCIYMCPYARFQSAMFDHDTLIISYDANRGDPRGSRKKSVDPKKEGIGDCVDCKLCVHACPTGIDIRDGLQYQCIGCAACIDACNGVMDKMGYEKNLVGYTTQNAIDGKPTKIIRARIIIYFLVLVSITALFVNSLINRIPLELDVLLDRNTLSQISSDGYVENRYTLSIANMDTKEHRYSITLTSDINAQLIIKENDILVAAGQVKILTVKVKADPAMVKNISANIQFSAQRKDNEEIKVNEKAVFISTGRM